MQKYFVLSSAAPPCDLTCMGGMGLGDEGAGLPLLQFWLFVLGTAKDAKI